MIAQLDKLFIKTSLKKTYTRLVSYFLFEGRPLTTKGRWINKFVFAFFKILKYIPNVKSIQKPVFILGTGRSGTTILGLTLGMHEDVGFLNEPKALWSHIYSGEDIIGSYQKEAGSYYLVESQVDAFIKKKANTLFGNYLRLSSSKRVVDKYPELIFRTPFVKEIFPDAKFLFLYRNGWDTCHSIKRWSERLGVDKHDETHDWWGLNGRKWNLLCDQVLINDPVLSKQKELISKYTNHVHMAAVEWILTMKQGLSLQCTDNLLAVKYEEYVSSEDYRNKILSFCSLEKDHNYARYCDEILKLPSIKEPIKLPVEIEYEFLRVMGELGYE
jgi:hypothetical protein